MQIGRSAGGAFPSHGQGRVVVGLPEALQRTPIASQAGRSRGRRNSGRGRGGAGRGGGSGHSLVSIVSFATVAFRAAQHARVLSHPTSNTLKQNLVPPDGSCGPGPGPGPIVRQGGDGM